MLLNFNVKNLAVFSDASIDFSKGFNVITGETGSGKSILIEALFLLCGARASKDYIRKGENRAQISALFDISDNIRALEYLKNNGIIINDDDYLIISREITENGKSINKINNSIVSTSILKELSIYLLDIYGQFEQQYLYKKENHIVLLDNINIKEISNILQEYEIIYKQYREKLILINDLKDKLIDKNSKLDRYKAEIDEIDAANITEDEEESLIKELKKVSNIKDIQLSIQKIDALLSSENESALEKLNQAYALLSKTVNYDDNLAKHLEKLDFLIEDLQGLTFGILDYLDNLNVDEEKLFVLENRISDIQRLKRKYGYTIDKIYEYRNLIFDEYNLLLDADFKLENLEKEHALLKKDLIKKSDELSKLRKQAALFLEENLVKELDDMNMKDSIFKVKILPKKDFSENGIDDVEFLISTNVGSDLNSIQKVVSGGEASRIMLAIKKLSSKNNYTSTLVFDEIDTGISGKTAQMAGNKMKYISNDAQVICITHSPQIASISDNHYLIEKTNDGNITKSYVKKLCDNEKIYEIARLLSGINITDEAVQNAKYLIESNS